AFDWLPERELKHAVGSDVRMVLDVQGIRCAACVWLLQAIWRRVSGGHALRISPSLGQVTLHYVAGADTGRRFVEMAARLGYPMAPVSRRVARDTGLLVRLGICAALRRNAVNPAVSHHFGLQVGTDSRSSLRSRP